MNGASSLDNSNKTFSKLVDFRKPTILRHEILKSTNLYSMFKTLILYSYRVFAYKNRFYVY